MQPQRAFDQLLDLIELRGGFDSDRLPGREPAELAAMIERAAALPLPAVDWVDRVVDLDLPGPTWPATWSSTGGPLPARLHRDLLATARFFRGDSDRRPVADEDGFVVIAEEIIAARRRLLLCRWRGVVKAIAPLLALQRRAAERAYAVGGTGFHEAAESYHDAAEHLFASTEREANPPLLVPEHDPPGPPRPVVGPRGVTLYPPADGPFGYGWVRDAMYHWDVDYFNLVFGMRPRLEHPPGHGHPPVDGAFGALHSTLATQEAAPGSRRRQGVESTRSV